MVSRLTPRLYQLLVVIAFGLLLGVAFARVELVLMVVPLLLAVIVGLVIDTPPQYGITHQVSALRLFEGDLLTVTITVLARSAVPLLEVLDPLHPSLEVVSGGHRAAFGLKAGQTVQWTSVLRCVRRGQFTLGTLHLRSHGRAGLWIHETQHVDPKPCLVYPQLIPLRRAVRPPHTQAYVGNYVAAALGEGIEFGNIRPFAPGDRVKRVNWRASLRLNDLYVNEFQEDRNADVVLMLDTLANVGTPSLNTLDLCVRAAASLAWAYLRRKDRVGLITYGGAFRWLKPGIGRAHFQAVLDQLLEAEVIFSYVARDLALVPKRILPPQALIIALSPLLDDRFVKALEDLLARTFSVTLLTVSPVAIRRAVLAPSPATDTACRLWTLERAARLEDLRKQGVAAIEWSPEQSLDAVLSAVTRGRHARRVPR